MLHALFIASTTNSQLSLSTYCNWNAILPHSLTSVLLQLATAIYKCTCTSTHVGIA